MAPKVNAPTEAADSSMMDRRSWLLASLGLLTLPLAAWAQAPARVFRIGALGGASPASPTAGHLWKAFYEGLRELGYTEGRNVKVEGRYYGDNIERLASLANELVRLQVDVIVAAAAPAPEAAMRATPTIPIVMTNHIDPVASGLVATLAKPGGNVTGLSLLASELRIKQLQLLKEILPGMRCVAFLRNPAVPVDLKELEAASQSLNLRTQVIQASAPTDLADAFATALGAQADAMIVLAGFMFWSQRARLAELAARNRLPTVYLVKEHVDAGGLIAYGPDLRDNFRRAAAYVDKILRGAKPSDLPIEQSTKFELWINLKAAKALGISIPPSVLALAGPDRIVE